MGTKAVVGGWFEADGKRKLKYFYGYDECFVQLTGDPLDAVKFATEKEAKKWINDRADDLHLHLELEGKWEPKSMVLKWEIIM